MTSFIAFQSKNVSLINYFSMYVLTPYPDCSFFKTFYITYRGKFVFVPWLVDMTFNITFPSKYASLSLICRCDSWIQTVLRDSIDWEDRIFCSISFVCKYTIDSTDPFCWLSIKIFIALYVNIFDCTDFDLPSVTLVICYSKRMLCNTNRDFY